MSQNKRISYNYFRAERETRDNQAQQCIANQFFPFHRINIFTDSNWSDYVPILIAVIPMYFSVVTPAIGKYISMQWPSRLSEENNPMINAHNRIEDGRTPRKIWIIKTVLGILLLYGVIHLISPYVNATPGYCTHLRKMEKQNFDVVQERPLELNGPERMSLIYDGESRYDCLSRRNIASFLVAGGILVTSLLSWVAPARKRYVPVRTSAAGTIMSMFYFVSIASLLVWGYGTMNRVKILNF